ncbi:MAG: hypothetical protein PHC28_15225 [Flavobacterium sp.]|uniref:hypothetical protein n=1 Tax=Flavobacterium sp. TaxID=239 RepID=UPI00262000C0|nr:hypothetical protein [Flavobacterium sp.]MDD5151806.1 hypothetical protein [Flavobacterium sp.]
MTHQKNSRLNEFNVYKDYVGIKTHFNEWGYFWHRTLDNQKITIDSFLKRKDKELFKYFTGSRLSLIEIMITHFLIDKEIYIRDILDKVYLDEHKERLIRLGKLNYQTKSEIESIIEYVEDNNISLKKLFLPENNTPIIKDLIIDLKLNIETLSILDTFFGFTKYSGNNPLWQEKCLSIHKYGKLLILEDRQKIKGYIDNLIMSINK